ncbi:hypothetical protein Sjap_025671 [Stephania japonica]|uniref:Transposase n=1 Tax=Stephania japonica TaxID=461633 RepID=A0AAP0HJS2_9MAGN
MVRITIPEWPHVSAKRKEELRKLRVRSGGADVTRADLWIEGHQNKKGQPHSDEIARVVEKINECQMRSSTSTSQSINKDPIAQVFGPEHQRRVKGLGFGVTSNSDRATTQSSILVRKLQGDFQILEEKYEQLAEHVRSQQMPPSSRQLVSEGEIETDDPMHLMDGIPIGEGAYLVYVEMVFDPNAFLWRNQNNWTTLDNALGEIIPWPKEAVAEYHMMVELLSDFEILNQAFADEIGIPFMETSAKSATNCGSDGWNAACSGFIYLGLPRRPMCDIDHQHRYGILMSGACCLWKARMGTQIWWWSVATPTMEEHRRSNSRRSGVGIGLTSLNARFVELSSCMLFRCCRQGTLASIAPLSSALALHVQTKYAIAFAVCLTLAAALLLLAYLSADLFA